MSYWAATGFGALDLQDHALRTEGYELVVTPEFPSTPQILWGDGAAMWRRALSEAIDDSSADEATRETIDELHSLGVLTRSDSLGTSLVRLAPPWLVSFQHELVYALLSHVARRAGIDILFIKGPVLHAQGLRTREHSGDVDCWVRPSDEKSLIEAMTEWGWSSVKTAFDGTLVAHSRTLAPGIWGCEIDVHTRFPGMTVDVSNAFDYVLSRSEERAFAGVSALVPSRAAHAVIYALHELRPLVGVGRSVTRNDEAERALEAAGADAIEAADRLGAGFVLHDVLRATFPDADLTRIDRTEPSDWRWRSIPSVPRRQLAALRLLPAKQRAVVFFRLLWPTRETSKRTRMAAEVGRSRLLLIRLRRIREAVRRLIRNK